jgi:hypothetical protein
MIRRCLLLLMVASSSVQADEISVPLGTESSEYSGGERLQNLVRFRIGVERPQSLTEQVTAEQQKLLQSLRSLQDAYCRAGQLDEAIQVRKQIRRLEKLIDPPLPAVKPDVAAIDFEFPASPPTPASGPVSSIRYDDHSQIGKTLYVHITGQTSGGLWGTGPYTADSDLGTAVVHAGFLKPGESGMAKITITPAQDSFASSTSNGVTTSSWRHYPSGYRIEDVGLLLDTAYSLRGTATEQVRVYVRGRADGIVWGSRFYTDDSDIATAAVHAGIVKAGEEGIVTVCPAEGRPSYSGTTQHGVTTRDYNTWPSGYFFSDDPAGKTPVKLTASVETTLSHEVQNVTGRTTGSVWGTDLYTSDSDLGTAAVHAGILKDGETSQIAVQRLPGAKSYVGSERNGVTSRPWTSGWDSSFRLSPLPK